MEVDLTLVALCSVLVGTGIYLMLERSLTRVLVGLLLLSNGVNVALLVAGGPAGTSAFYGRSDPAEMADPLPQALILTCIVITLGTVAFVLAMAHRSWQLSGNDDVQDDVEDAAIRRLARVDSASDSHALTTSGEDDGTDDDRTDDDRGSDERPDDDDESTTEGTR